MLKRLEIAGFKSFARKTVLDFSAAATSIVGPNGSGKSNVAEAFRFALGEQSMKSMRGKRSEDLIWAGSHTTARANRAAVAIVFDNTPKHGQRVFPKLDFDEVAIERAVFRDGASEYSINGSKARLRDIQELLASANIGETGHHIISQGEADRILLASPRDRRAMLEDALGLKVYEFKKQEAERKLEKTEENVREVEAIRRELAPHIRFLAKQVERLERAEELSKDLAEVCRTYFAIEEKYIEVETRKTEEEKHLASSKLAKASGELAKFEERTTTDVEGLKRADAVRHAERELDRSMGEQSALAREIGRTEGALEGAKKRSEGASNEPYVKIPREDLQALKTEVEAQVRVLDTTADAGTLAAVLQTLRSYITAFFDRFVHMGQDYLAEEESTLYALQNELESLNKKMEELTAHIERTRSSVLKAREHQIAYEESGREEQHRLLQIAESKAHEEANVARLEARLRELTHLHEEMQRQKVEVLPLAGQDALKYAALHALPHEERQVQEERKRTLERLKIRAEEAGGTGEDVRMEYQDTKAREEFLAHELEDLSRSREGLRALITDLDAELAKSFTEGLSKVNASFSEFFSLMFGGGSAKLVLETIDPNDEEDEDEEQEVKKDVRPGIEISVHLPKKKVQSLMQLSGGERALTSIALIFAMSQVNPPPFLILDETDAALDEANSRRYGDMIEELAKKSQLIVITHNRETMSRAGILYGVTMGGDGVSKLLSVKFEEAAQVAK